MSGTVHAMSGAIIGAVVHPLALAIPLAFMSHFFLDSLPHYGIQERLKNNSLAWRFMMFGDAGLALCIAATGIILQKWSMEICGWLAYSPDGIWALYYFRDGHHLALQPRGPFTRFHRHIQNESNQGIAYEVILAALMLPILIFEINK